MSAIDDPVGRALARLAYNANCQNLPPLFIRWRYTPEQGTIAVSLRAEWSSPFANDTLPPEQEPHR